MISFLQVSDANDLNQFGLVSNILDQFDFQIIVLIWSHLNKHQVLQVSGCYYMLLLYILLLLVLWSVLKAVFLSSCVKLLHLFTTV